MKKYHFSATLLYSCEAENDDEAWEHFQEYLADGIFKPDDFDDIEWEEVD